jgi:hypothetical protein
MGDDEGTCWGRSTLPRASEMCRGREGWSMLMLCMLSLFLPRIVTRSASVALQIKYIHYCIHTYIHTYIHAPRIVTRSASVALRAEQGRRDREESGAARCHASAAGSALPGVAAGCALYATDWLFVFGHVTCVTRSPARIAACECVLMRSL